MEFKRIWFIAMILFSAFSIKAQENYFVYLQTENNKPFYARLNNKVVSSTSSGYMILPKIAEGKYEVTIGFPKNEFGEESFTIDINKKSQGYLLKDFGEKGWSLFNLQTLALINPNTSPAPGSGVANNIPEKKEDAFSQMLASVTKDSTLLRKNIPVQIEPAAPVKEKADSVAKIENLAVSALPEQEKISGQVETSAKTENVKEEKSAPPSEIIYTPGNKLNSQPVKILGVIGRDGNEMIYVDNTGISSDTITVFIPNEKESYVEMADVKVKEAVSPKNELEFTITPTVISPVKEENADPVVIKKEESGNKSEAGGENEANKPLSQVFIIRDDSPSRQNENKSENSMILIPAPPTKSVNSDCKNLANNSDFLKIRKRMAAEKDKDAMVLAAKKIFKTKCFSTEQIRNLSYLFLSDEGRYMFFDAAYPYTSDTDRYPSLVSQLKDEYYINRFEAMIQK